MSVFWLIVGVLFLTFGASEPAGSTSFNLTTNGDFSSGLLGWSITNPDQHPLGITWVDIDGPGPLASSEAFFVQTGGGLGSRDVSMSQSIILPNAGEYTLSADIAAAFIPNNTNFINNLSGGAVTVAFDGKTIASHDFGEIAARVPEFATLTASFMAASNGVLDINFFRPFNSTIDSPINYLDNVFLAFNGGTAAPVPETSSLLMIGMGLVGLAVFGKQKLLKQ